MVNDCFRSNTQGKGEFSMEYSRYSPCSSDLQEKLVRQYQEEQGIIEVEKKKKKNWVSECVEQFLVWFVIMYSFIFNVNIN